MAIPTTIESLSTTAASNGPAGSEQRTLADDGLRQAYAFIRQVVSLGSNIASATTITPPSTASVFNITGTTTINAVITTNWDAGACVRLIFADSVTVKNNTAGGASTATMLLAGGADFSATANDALTLCYNGTNWIETARSVN